MKKLLAVLLFSTPLAVALPAAAKYQSFGSTAPAAEEGDKDKATPPDQEKKEFQVSDDEQDKTKSDDEKKEFQVSEDENTYDDKIKPDQEKKEFQVSDDEQDKTKSDDEKKEFQA